MGIELRESRGCTPPGDFIQQAAAHLLQQNKITQAQCLSPHRAAKWAVCSWVSHTHTHIAWIIKWRRCARVREEKRARRQEQLRALTLIKKLLVGLDPGSHLFGAARVDAPVSGSSHSRDDEVACLSILPLKSLSGRAAGAEFVTHTLDHSNQLYFRRRLRPARTWVLFVMSYTCCLRIQNWCVWY
jgi:hypothetical protein